MSLPEGISIEGQFLIGIPENATYIAFEEEEQKEVFQIWLEEEGLEIFKKYYDEVLEDIKGEE